MTGLAFDPPILSNQTLQKDSQPVDFRCRGEGENSQYIVVGIVGSGLDWRVSGQLSQRRGCDGCETIKDVHGNDFNFAEPSNNG